MSSEPDLRYLKNRGFKPFVINIKQKIIINIFLEPQQTDKKTDFKCTIQEKTWVSQKIGWL